ncbi:hypothetical protein L195_g004836 [Trifolium pratense]|uniref:Uncharacterized protein n=1 Tax=Trifolium pratense TaxID=57577 RepID=A0A2K3NZ63_TRIPR|nr:hypothetical protein L195_g004836 [Trifolium pratense]
MRKGTRLDITRDTVGDSSDEEEGSLLYFDELSDSESEDELCDCESEVELSVHLKGTANWLALPNYIKSHQIKGDIHSFCCLRASMRNLEFKSLGLNLKMHYMSFLHDLALLPHIEFCTELFPFYLSKKGDKLMSATPTPSTISVYDSLVGKFILIKDTSVIGEMVGDCSEEKEEPLISKELDSSDLSDSDSEDD